MVYNKFIKKNILMVAGVIFLQLIIWGIQVLVQFFSIRAFDGVIKLDFNLFLKWTVIGLVFWFIYFSICSLESYMRAKTIKYLNNSVRHEIYISIYNNRISKLESEDKSDYISYVTNNVYEITRLLWEPLFDFAGRIFQIIWSVLALLYIDIYLFLYAIVAAAILLYLPRFFERKMEKVADDNLKKQALSMGKFKDILYGISIIKLLNAKKWYINKGLVASNISENAKFRQSYITDIIECVMGFFSVLVQASSEVIVFLLAIYGRIDVAVIIGAANLIGGVSNGLNQLLNARVSISQSKPYIKIFKDSYNDSTELTFNKKISLENIFYSYNERKLLKDINFDFLKNHKYAIVGKSGAGKSTLLKIIMGINEDYLGDIKYDGLKREKNTFDRNISYISQNVYLFNDTIKENILLGANFSESKLNIILENCHLKDFIDKLPLGIDTIVGENGKLISGGEKQRIALARSLVHSKDVLLIDEGLNALDRGARNEIINNLLNDKNLTLIMVTHNLEDNLRDKFDKIYEI